MTKLTDREKIIVAKIDEMKAKHGITGIKVEFEAKFHRELARVFNDCTNCSVTGQMCNCCEGEGRHQCDCVDEYDGDGQPDSDCDDCDGTGFYGCEECEDRGFFACTSCDRYPNEGNRMNWQDWRMIHDKLLEKLVEHKLAKPLAQGESTSFHTHKFKPLAPLVFSHAYRDGTVDSEWTLTLDLKKSKSILMLPILCQAFASLADEIGQPIDVSNAGMHMAWLFSDNATYPADITASNLQKFNNFRRSMNLLMPALFFLGSSTSKSRPMGYRQPGTHNREKYMAISLRNGALEFRLFETCYQRPEQMLDNVMVMANCMRFWTLKYTRNYLAKITPRIMFGNDDGDELARMYVTTEHIDLLNRGLRMIKPSYLTVAEIKHQRSFNITKNHVKDVEKNARAKAELEYIEYEKRFKWDTIMSQNSYINSYIQSSILSGPREDIPKDPGEFMEKIRAEAEKQTKERFKLRPKEEFIEAEKGNYMSTGDYELCAE